MATSWDPDPDVPYIEVTVLKSNRMVGLKAGNAPGPSEYPFVQMIGVGTPIDRCQDIDIGDKLKSVNGVFLKGKTRKDVHDMVKKIEIGSEIVFKVIKSFKDKKLVADAGDTTGWGVRVASVRRTNPLMSMMSHESSFQGEEIREEDEGEEEEVLADLPTAAPVAVEENKSKFSRGKNKSVYGGFGDPEPEPQEPAQPKKSGFRRKGSVYNGFGDADRSGDADKSGDVDGFGDADGFGDDEPTDSAAATVANTVAIDGEDYGFGDVDEGGDWG